MQKKKKKKKILSNFFFLSTKIGWFFSFFSVITNSTFCFSPTILNRKKKFEQTKHEKIKKLIEKKT